MNSGDERAPLGRRAVLLSALALAACSREKGPGYVDPLDAAVAGDWRPNADRSRDRWRHPAETLRLLGLQPGQTVAEFWPGAGYTTAILAPYLRATGGRLVAAQAPDAELARRYRQRFADAGYGRITHAAFGPASPPPAAPASVDLALFQNVIHLWMAAGLAEKAFADARVILRSGGVLGLEQHRLPGGGPQDPLAASGYVQQAYIRSLAEEFGLRFDGTSEVNANPADDHSHIFGVWTLPPVRRSSGGGRSLTPEERAAYDGVGESDRMTLRFRKP